MEHQLTYFISYTTRTANDIAWAKWVCWVLENKLNAKTIMQEYDFHPGDNFKERMHKALINADVVVCVLTRDYLESANCTEEWTNAERIIPVKFDDCTPPGLLKSRVYIDLYGLDRDSARDRLITRIKGTPRPVDEPDAPFASASIKNDEQEFPITQDSMDAKHILPNRNGNFIGREDELLKIYDGLSKSSAVIITGAGGFGKTQTAIEYAYRHVSEYEHIFYFDARSEMQLQEGYRNFALRKLDFKNAREGAFDIVHRYIYEWFRKNTSYLLIYDNAEGCPDLKKYLPYRQAKGHIVINSREQLQGIAAERLKATVFTPADAFVFMKGRIFGVNLTDADDAAIRELTEALGYLPLALECAAAYIVENDYTAEKYLDLWEKHKLKVLNTLPPDTEYEQTLLTTWNATFEKISQEAEKDEQMKAAVQLFKLCTYCAPDNIPFQLFIDGREEAPQPLKAVLDPDNEPEHDKLISKLTRYSLISMRRSGSSGILITVHRLIQEAASYNFDQNRENKEWVSCCLNIAISVFDYQFGTREEFDKFTINLPHVLEIAKHAESFLDDEESQLTVALIYSMAGFGLEKQGYYAKALAWYYKALEIQEKTLGKENLSTARTYNDIAGVYKQQGEYIKAMEWYDKALSISEDVLGTEYQFTATIYNDIAGVYKIQWEHTKALEWYYKALSIREKVLGTEHPSTATTYNNIAGVYKDQGEYAKALEWYDKALKIDEKVFGIEHPVTAATYNNIAVVYHDQGEYAKAMDCHDKALEICEKVLGTEHPSTATTYNNIAGVYKDQGEHDKALEWFDKALKIFKKVLGEEHPNTAEIYNSIACVYHEQGEYDKALELFDKALEIKKMIFGAEHHLTVTTRDNIVSTKLAMEKT